MAVKALSLPVLAGALALALLLGGGDSAGPAAAGFSPSLAVRAEEPEGEGGLYEDGEQYGEEGFYMESDPGVPWPAEPPHRADLSGAFETAYMLESLFGLRDGAYLFEALETMHRLEYLLAEGGEGGLLEIVEAMFRLESLLGAFGWHDRDGLRSFTPGGAGTVLDNLVNATGLEFLSVEAADGSVFYIVIDRFREYDNVYLLRAVAAADLVPLAEDAEDFYHAYGRRDLTNEELLMVLAELIASGIYVSLQDPETGLFPEFPDLQDLPGRPGAEDGEGAEEPRQGGETALLVAIFAAIAALAAGVYFFAPKLRAMWRNRKGPPPDWGDDEGFDGEPPQGDGDSLRDGEMHPEDARPPDAVPGADRDEG